MPVAHTAPTSPAGISMIDVVGASGSTTPSVPSSTSQSGRAASGFAGSDVRTKSIASRQVFGGIVVAMPIPTGSVASLTSEAITVPAFADPPSIEHPVPSQRTVIVVAWNGSGRGAPRRSASSRAGTNRSASADMAARIGRPVGERRMRPAESPSVSTVAVSSSHSTRLGSTSAITASVSQNDVPWVRDEERANISNAMSAPAGPWSPWSVTAKSGGTGTSFVASSGTRVTGTFVAITAATDSGSTPRFHSTPCSGFTPSWSMLPGTSIAPPIAWMRATRSTIVGSAAKASAMFVQVPSGTSVMGESEAASVSTISCGASPAAVDPLSGGSSTP